MVEREDPLSVREIWAKLNAAVRNDGRSGIGSYAISAINVALWDLHARLFDVPLCDLLGRVRDEVMVYGSGGFTSYVSRRCAISSVAGRPKVCAR